MTGVASGFDLALGITFTFECNDLESNTVHLQIKPLKNFSCIECEASFERKTYLEYHMNSAHLKIKPYKCDYCDSCFATKPHLKRHVKTVHLEI